MDKGSQKGTKKGAESQGVFTVAFFRPFFASFFFSDFNQYRTLDLDFLDLHPFCMLKLKRGKKPGEKRWEYEKGRWWFNKSTRGLSLDSIVFFCFLFLSRLYSL
jgi:hypothetical protein